MQGIASTIKWSLFWSGNCVLCVIMQKGTAQVHVHTFYAESKGIVADLDLTVIGR